MFYKTSKQQKSLEELKKYIHFLVTSKKSNNLLQFACEKVGIPFEELLPMDPEDLPKNSGKEVNDLRFSHMEARRKAKINILAEFLLDHQMMKTESPEKSKRTMTPTPNLNESQSERKLKNLKRNIYYQLSVEENLKRIRQEQEEEKKMIQDRIKEKETREINKEADQMKKMYSFRLRDQRIKEKLDLKKKKEEEYEDRGLKYDAGFKKKDLVHVSSFAKQTDSETETDEDVSEKLAVINEKLNKSAVRAKKNLDFKKIPAKQVASQIIKVKTTREQILNKLEEEKTIIMLKIKKEREESTKRREFELNKSKLSRSLKAFKNKKIDSDSFIEKKNTEKEEKNKKIEQIRKELKESYEQKSQIISMKIALKKKDQEQNLRRIVLLQKSEKSKLIEKIKGELTPIKKNGVDISSLRAEITKEFKKQISQNPAI